MSGHEKFYIPHDDLVSLEAAMASLETATEVLQAAIEVLSSKMGTPENLADLITGYSAEFDFRDVGQFLTITNFAEKYHRGLTFDGAYFYTFEADLEDIIRWSWIGTTQTTFYDPHTDIAGLCWDILNSRLVAVEDADGSAGIYTISAAGALLDTQTVTYSDWADAHPLALCYDEQNDKFYIVVRSDTEYLVAIGEVSPSTGVISSALEFPYKSLHLTRDMEYVNGVLSLLVSGTDYDKIINYRVGDSAPLSFSDSPAAPNDNFCMDKTSKMWYFFSRFPNDVEGDEIAYVTKRILTFAPARRVLDGGGSITVDGVVTVTPSSTADLDTIEATLTNLEKATAAVDEDKLIVQREDAADNVAPAMDVAARAGFQKITDGTNAITLVKLGVYPVAALYGPLCFGRRSAYDAAAYLPVAGYADDLVNKGEYVIPVTPMTSEREEGTRTHTNDACFVVSYEANAVEAKTGYVLIDLSNATNYPHTLTTEIHVDWLAFSMLGDVSCEGHVHIGFISAIDATKGTMICFVCKPADKIARANFVSRQYNPSAVRCKTAAVLAGGAMKIVDDTTFQNDVALAGTYEAVIPAVGDLVMLIDRVAGKFETVSVAIGYHTI